MHSCIYEGRIRHRRFAPVTNAFNYKLFMMYLDLAELPHLFDRHRLWSSGGVNLAHFRRRDHLGDPDTPLDESVRRHVREHTGEHTTGPIRLLTHLRYFGYRFNPVNFFFCFDAQDQHVETIVAEITNTPWSEQHAYVLGEALNTGQGKKKRYTFAKTFHVSPFMAMEQQYTWHFTQPGSHLGVHMDNWQDGDRLFDATMTLQRSEITGSALARVLCQYPLMTARVTAAIHWQAAKLYLKKCPFYPHPKSLVTENV